MKKMCEYSKVKVSVWNETNAHKSFRTPNPPNLWSMFEQYIWVVIHEEKCVGTAKLRCLYETRQTETHKDTSFRAPYRSNVWSISVQSIWVVINEETCVGTAKIRCLYDKRQTETRVSTLQTQK
jgi:NAD-dependent dihydropyrimidine dehydrogenase PreA subunit